MALPIMGFDCAMIGAGRKGGRAVAGQVSLVDESGNCVYNVYVKHKLKIKDYRTAITGITEANIANNGITYKKVKSDVAAWIKHRILVGHDLDKLKKLGLSHPDWNKRDSAEYFKTERNKPILKNLAAIHLGIPIQNGVEYPYQNARIVVRLYKKYQKQWDDQVDEIYAEEEQSDEEMSGEELPDEEESDEEMSDEEESDEEMSDEEQSDEEMSRDESEYTSSSDD